MAKVTRNPICTLTNLNTRTRSSTLYANARTVLDSILLKFQRQPKKPPPTSSFREERGRRDSLVARWGESLFSRMLWFVVITHELFRTLERQRNVITNSRTTVTSRKLSTHYYRLISR